MNKNFGEWVVTEIDYVEPKDECFAVNLWTAGQSDASFSIVGYGAIPLSCYERHGNHCSIFLCGETELELNADGSGDSDHDWDVSLSGEIGEVVSWAPVSSADVDLVSLFFSSNKNHPISYLSNVSYKSN